MSLLRKVVIHKIAAKSLRQQDKQSRIKSVIFAKLRDFEPSRQEEDLWEGTQDFRFREENCIYVKPMCNSVPMC